MTTQVRYEKEDLVIESMKRHPEFKKFMKNLPSDVLPSDIVIKLSYDPIPPKEVWKKMPTGEVTRQFAGNIRQRFVDNRSGEERNPHLIEEVEFNNDGSTRKVRYYNPDW